MASTARPTRPICFQSQWESMGLCANVSVSGISDIGGASNSQNQDAFFSFYDPKNAALVVGLFDGHGRDTGRDVATAAKRYFETQFQSFSHEDYERLEQDPNAFFQYLFEACHAELKHVLKEIYEHSGHFVEEHQPEGFMVRHDLRTGVVANARGGTTATIVVVLNGGEKIYTSNVGDSVAMLTAVRPVLQASDVEIHEASTNKLLVAEPDEVDEVDELNNNHPPRSELLLLSGNHSPDCSTEFVRAREACCNPLDASLPALRFVYDTSEPRSRRLPIFTMSIKGEFQHHPSGDYYKNVRDEWASVVATPFTALFPDALAFTRSLGDFHMHSYGVSCDPTVTELSLERIVRRDNGHEQDNQDKHTAATGVEADCLSTNNNGEQQQQQSFLLMVASDGVWDNWTYHDLRSFLCETGSVHQHGKLSDEEKRVVIGEMASSLMSVNLRRAKGFFGEQADNMTAVLINIELK